MFRPPPRPDAPHLLLCTPILLLLCLPLGCATDDVASGIHADAGADTDLVCAGYKIATGSCAKPYTCVADNPCSAAPPRTGCGCGGELISIAAGCPNAAYSWIHDGLSWFEQRAPGGKVLCDPANKPPEHLDARVRIGSIPGPDGALVTASIKAETPAGKGGPVTAKSVNGAAELLLAGAWQAGRAVAELTLRIDDLPATTACPKGVDLAWTVTAAHDFDLRDAEIGVDLSAANVAPTCR